MRFMSVVSLLIAGFIALYALCKGVNLNDTTPLVSVFVGAAFGSKVWQKAYELKITGKSRRNRKFK